MFNLNVERRLCIQCMPPFIVLGIFIFDQSNLKKQAIIFEVLLDTLGKYRQIFRCRALINCNSVIALFQSLM